MDDLAQQTEVDYPSDQPRATGFCFRDLLPLALSARVSLLGAGTTGTGLALGCVYALRGVSEAWNSRRPLLVSSEQRREVRAAVELGADSKD